MHRFLAYFVYLVAFVNLLYFFNENNYKCIAMFVLTAILTSFFSKNKVIILGVAIVVGNVLCVGERWKEGFGWKKGKKKMKKKIADAGVMDLLTKIALKLGVATEPTDPPPTPSS